MPSAKKPVKRIGIVGGGASGAIAAIFCWQRLGDAAEISIYDPSSKLGLGMAYAPRDPSYLLNVPAEKMSVEPGNDLGFAQWLKQKDPNVEQGPHWPFVARRDFGEYLQERLRQVPFRHVRRKVAAARARGCHYELTLSSAAVAAAGDTRENVDYLLIATGFEPGLLPVFRASLGGLENRILQPEQVERANVSGEVLVIGAGLTAIDAWRSLRGRAQANITLLSRRGLLPLSQSDSAPVPRISSLSGMSPSQILRALRALQRRAAAEATEPAPASEGAAWAAIADQVRAQAQAIWSCWTERERGQFLRHLKPYWEVIRHRMPSSVCQEAQAALADGRLRALRGRVVAAAAIDGRIGVDCRHPLSGARQRLTVDWIVLATGPRISQSLEREIFGVRRCPLGLGYINESAARLWVVGPAGKALYWEITAVPEIRAQAQAVAEAIAQGAGPGLPLYAQSLRIHPQMAGESYFVHLQKSLSFSRALFKLGTTALAHALLPCFFVDTTSRGIRDIFPVLSKRRLRASAPRPS